MFRFSLIARIPLAFSFLLLVFSTALISLALHGVSRQFDRQVANLGQVYLDGLSAAILPAVRGGDAEQMVEVLNRALDTHLGVVDRTLAVVTDGHRLLAHVARYPEPRTGSGRGACWTTSGLLWECWWPILMSVISFANVKS
ncbi:hypothetical protein G6F57_021762 [Rhizopus arrhizus]|nr:hypothetical protein G6F57_021762 [Rhizopus arrhizus]